MPATLSPPTPAQRPAAIAPLPGESQAEFVDRVWDSLPGSDVAKARFCRDAWFVVRDGDLSRIAAERFPRDQYRSVSGSAVFKEHSTSRQTTDAYGKVIQQPVIYDRAALEAVCERNNQRIRDTGDFSPLCDGHTPDKAMLAKGAAQPDVLGFAGPFYLGKLGGQFAIFCDEHHQRGDVERIDRLQRRSPEVWLEERMEDRFFDPIACLGAQTPRLDLGMTRYGRLFETVGSDGANLMKYAAPAAPSGGNTFVPSDDPRKRHAAGDGSMLDNESIQQILQAITETQAFQTMQKLAPIADQLVSLAGTAPAAPSAEPAAPASPAAPPAESPAPAPAPSKPSYEPDDEDRAMMSRYMGGECQDDEFQQYMAGKRQQYSALPALAGAAGSMVGNAVGGAAGSLVREGMTAQNAAGNVAPETPPNPAGGVAPSAVPRPPTGSVEASQYARQNERIEISRYQRENESLRRQVLELEEKARQAERYQKLTSRRAEGYVFDLEDEYQATRDYTDEQFNRHVERQIARYERAPLDVPLMPTDDLESPKQTATQQYARTEAIKAIALKDKCNWAEATAKYEKQHSAS